MSRRTTAAGVAALVVALSAGCATFGTSEVQKGRDVGVPVLPPINLQFDGPVDDATPAEIVRGFLSASLSGQDLTTAKQFLTQPVIDTWDPRTNVVVYPRKTSPTITTLPSTRPDRVTVRISVARQAQIDASGRLQEAGAGRVTADISLASVSGQWRISALPSNFGLWVSHSYLDQLFMPMGVAYLSTASDQMIMDQRWFPLSSRMATELAGAMLDPVPDYLRGAARSAFPAGAQLEVDAVPVVNGVARLPVPVPLVGSPPETLRDAWAQALATIGQARTVSSVVLEAGGKDVDVVGLSRAPSSLADLGRTPARTGEADELWLHRADSLEKVRTATLSSGVVAGEVPRANRDQGGVVPLSQGWAAAAVAEDGKVLAAVGGNRAELHVWRGGDPNGVTIPLLGSQLSRPSIDVHGGIWVAGVDSEGRSAVWVVDRDASTGRRVAAPWLGSRRILDLRVAADGQRAAIVVDGGGETGIVAISGITRSSSALPAATALSTPLRIGAAVRDPLTVNWVDDRSVVTVARPAAGQARRPVFISLSGASTPLPPLEDVRAVFSTGSTSGLFARAGENAVYHLRGDAWGRVTAATDVVVPGT